MRILRALDDWLFDYFFQKLANFSFNVFGISGIRLSWYFKLFLTLFLMLGSYFQKSYFFFVVFSILVPLYVWEYGEILIPFENRLLEGFKNKRRIMSLYFFFRMSSIVFFVEFLLRTNLIKVDSFSFMKDAFFVFPFMFFLYLEACDIHPPKRKVATKLALQN